MPLAPRAAQHVDALWDAIVPSLEEYISIPNVSVAFDPDWAAHGHMQRAVELVRDWCASRDDRRGDTSRCTSSPGARR